MVYLLLLLFVGAIYAQEKHDLIQKDDLADHYSQDDDNKLQDDLDLQDDLELKDDLEKTPDDDFQLQKPLNATVELMQGNSVEGTCTYTIYTAARNFYAARRFCNCNHGRMASIHSACTNRLVRNLGRSVNQGYVWIGVWKPRRCRGYRNVDNSRLDYTNFAWGQCRRHGRWCVAMYAGNGLWYSVDCRVRLPFICGR
ncbi:bone marrow proteoglycan [Hyperolius riggenbachi]|uniref:bone marrow proteoglycan n=1 Tax=Hyperolius riggenbachi TaxID=752182 RepID=UPI0035A315B8